MSENKVLRAWEEIVISQEKGGRIVHYILKDSVGNSLLAVVGKDRSVNHMSYAVSEDYLRVFGPTGDAHAHAGTKWRARRDVVHWLVSVVSRGGPVLANSNDVISDGPVVKCEPNYKRLKTELLSKGPDFVKLVLLEPQNRVSKFSENIEVLSQDSGLQGCWFRCKILHPSQDRLRVRYKDVMEVDGLRKLQDWVPASRVTSPDKLGMRCVGRLTVRPSSCEYSSDGTFVLGAAVDAWWCNGWWEGVVIGCDTPKRRNFQVYFPGENRFLTIARRHVRISRDWIDGKWVNIKAKPDILSFLSSLFSSGWPKHRPLPIYSSPLAISNMVNPQKREKSEDDKRQIPSSFPHAKAQGVEELNFKKRLIRRYNEEMRSENGSPALE